MAYSFKAAELMTDYWRGKMDPVTQIMLSKVALAELVSELKADGLVVVMNQKEFKPGIAN